MIGLSCVNSSKPVFHYSWPYTVQCFFLFLARRFLHSHKWGWRNSPPLDIFCILTAAFRTVKIHWSVASSDGRETLASLSFDRSQSKDQLLTSGDNHALILICLIPADPANIDQCMASFRNKIKVAIGTLDPPCKHVPHTFEPSNCVVQTP